MHCSSSGFLVGARGYPGHEAVAPDGFAIIKKAISFPAVPPVYNRMENMKTPLLFYLDTLLIFKSPIKRSPLSIYS
jgi:hypothetical protein